MEGCNACSEHRCFVGGGGVGGGGGGPKNTKTKNIHFYTQHREREGLKAAAAITEIYTWNTEHYHHHLSSVQDGIYALGTAHMCSTLYVTFPQLSL